MAALSPFQAQSSPDTLPLPPGTRTGQLPNGLRYILRRNPIPASRIEFRLILQAGSVQELDHERGCAHFLEHIAFGGSRHFPGKSMQRYLESLGMKYGEDINAFTSQDRTIYLFAIPTDLGGQPAVDSALLILRDWLDGLSISPSRVETERGIILEELRGYDVGDAFYELKIGDGIHSRRMPLGTPSDIRRISAPTLEAFHRKWYVPSLATIVAVGDLDPDRMERAIRRRFSTLPPRPAPGPIGHTLEYARGTRLAEIRDTLYERTELEVMIPHPGITVRRLTDAVSQARSTLLTDAVSARLRGRGLRTSVSDAWYLSDKNHFTVTVSGTTRHELLENLAHLSSALHDLAATGWDAAELDAIRRRRCARMARSEVDAPQSSAAWCADFTDYVLSGDLPLRDTTLHRRVIDSVAATTGAELQAMLRSRLQRYDTAARIACRSHPGLGMPLRSGEVDEAWRRGATTPCPPYAYTPDAATDTAVEAVRPPCLSVRLPYEPSQIVSTRSYPNLGVREAELRNGLRLVMRPTPGGGPILLTLLGPYGLSSIPDAQYPLLEGTAGYMEMGGIAKANRQQLSEYLYRNDIALSVTLENHWHGFMGMAPAASAPELFNLIREKITDPELDHREFESLRQEQLAEPDDPSLLSRLLQRASDRQLTARMNELTGATLPRPTPPPTQREVARMLNLDSIASFYRRLYTPTVGSFAVVTGDFHPDTLLRQFAAAFSPLPARSHGEEFRHTTAALPTQRMVEGFDNDNETQTLFDLLYLGHYTPSLRSTLKLKLMRDLLRNRLISILRERESLVYSPFISLFYEGIPGRSFCFDINASADNRNMAAIDTLLRTILADLRHKSVSPQELTHLKRSFRIARRETLTDDAASAWRNTLTGLLRNGESLSDFDSYDRILDSITADELRDSFSQLLDPERFVLLYQSKERLKDDTTDR